MDLHLSEKIVHEITLRQQTVKSFFCKTFDAIFNRANITNQTLTWLV